MNLTDIRQGKNGDCFILSTIISILHTYGEEFINKILIKLDSNNYEFNYYINNTNNEIIKTKINFIYPIDNNFCISPKSKDWVKQIEYIYIKLFYNNDNNKVINEGGIAKDVLTRLCGKKSKIIINRIFDNKTQLYYDICNERINNYEWTNDFIKPLNIISKYKLTIFIKRIWKLLTSYYIILPNTYYNVKFPCVIGINGHFNINIPGIINEHLYSVLGFMIDKYKNKYIYVFNPHHNVDARITSYNEDKKTFISKIEKSRYGIWAFDEIIVFISDFTYCK